MARQVTWYIHLKPKGRSSRAEGVYMRQTMSAHIPTIMYHLVIGHKSMYVTNFGTYIANIKLTSTTTPN